MLEKTPPFVAAVVHVDAVERVSPSFVRIVLAGDALRGIGNPGRTFDQRIKLVFPAAAGRAPVLPPDTTDWYAAWLAVPEAERGTMRTYSIREVRVEPDGTTRLVVDFVLHLVEGETGPASSWANAAEAGHELLLVAPRRGRFDGGGIEFDTERTGRLLLAGDETAAPAIASILEDLPRDAVGAAFIEVPERADALAIDAPVGIAVHWLARAGEAHGSRLLPAVLEHLGVAPDRVRSPGAADASRPASASSEDLLWETPSYSGAGETVDEPDAPGAAHSDDAFWIAGESAVVTKLRRHLVKDLGIPRAQVAFMGYWRRGVAMKG
ncbi:siderophore-interacting protein [Leucobacter sp. GX0328]